MKVTKSDVKLHCIRWKILEAGGVETAFLDRLEGLKLPREWIPETILALPGRYFKECGTIRSVLFESN
jgi:hypothetical protein